MLSLRVTQEQDQLLSQLAEALGLAGGKAELLRRALDYWLEQAPEVKKALKGLERHKEEG
jgi:hypothetical protein